MAPTIALCASQSMNENPIAIKDINKLIRFLNQFEFINIFLSEIAIFIQQSRKKYVLENQAYFLSKSEKAGYLTDWVANYEISNFLKF